MNFKHVSVALLLLGLSGCAYPSRDQARQGCNEWKEKGEQGVVFARTFKDIPETKVSSRKCSWEKETSQFLGSENKVVVREIKEGKLMYVGDVMWEDYKVVKYFRY